MLGRLATWLRLLGYDTVYSAKANDQELARRARAEDRILLTRDIELTRRRGVRCVRIESEQVEEQLAQVFRELHLQRDAVFSRCPACNAPLQLLDRQQAQGRVPPYVFLTQEQFRRCPQCGRVYWRGTHWAHILASLQDLEN